MIQAEIFMKLIFAQQPHKLSGKYADLWECHVKPDWL